MKVPPPPRNPKPLAIRAFLAATALLCFAPLEQSQAQLYIHVYPSQDDNGKTIWIFSGSSTASAAGNIRTGTESNSNTFNPGQFRDSFHFVRAFNNGNIFDANKPDDANFQLSPLFGSTNAVDIESIRKRIPGGARTNLFASSATNTPTVTIGSGSRTISHLFMDDDSLADDLGIRVASSRLSYSSGNSSSWVGAGIVNKPIGDFFAGTFTNWVAGLSQNDPTYAAAVDGSVRVSINSHIIPEPEEYALVFGLFALVFVILHRRMQKKRRQAAAAL